METLIKILLRMLILNLSSIIIPVLLIVQILHHKHRTPEIKIFFRMCIFDLLLCLTYVISSIYLLHYINDEITNETIGSVIHFSYEVLIGILPLTLVVHWLLFVEYTLHQSRDIIHRRYGPAQFLFIIGLLVSFLSAIPISDESPIWLINVTSFMYRLQFLIWALYIASSYVILYKEKKRMAIPQYIVLTPTVVSIILGLLVSALTSYVTDTLGYGIGLMFADYFMFRRLSYIDPETGFFNEKYMPVLIRAAKKTNINKFMTIRFKVSGDSSRWTVILNSWKPEHCKIINKKGGEFLLISDTLKETVAERFITLISDDCRKEGIEMAAHTETMTL